MCECVPTRCIDTLDLAERQQIDAKETTRCKKQMLIELKLGIAVNYFDAKKCARCSRVLHSSE